jgi:lysophospholipase L1-like esterase
MNRRTPVRLLPLFLVGLPLTLLSCRSVERIVFLGDSITQEGDSPHGYIGLMREAAREAGHDAWELIGAGVSGNKVPDLQARLERDVLSKKPTLVVIYIGINDVWHFALGIGGTPKDRYEAGLRDLLARVKESGSRALLCTPSVIGEKSDGSNPLDPMLEEYAAITRTVAASTGTPLCDLRSSFLLELKKKNPENLQKGVLTRDGVHLNDSGNRFVAETLLEALEESLER